MSLKIKDGMVLNEKGVAIMIITDLITDEEERDIQIGIESVPIIKEFIADVNHGSFKPRTTVKKFENILAKYE